jgi:two-component system invasion response regulator UvrY
LTGIAGVSTLAPLKAIMGNHLKLLIVDDHYFVRQGIISVLSENFENAFFGEASNAQEALEKGGNAEWDVVLLDISMPGRGGLDVLKELKATRPRMPVIILSMHEEEQFAIRVLKLGASSYIRKDSAGQELVTGIQFALRGAKYITPSIAERLALHVEKDQDGPAHESLSNREFQVMRLIATGRTVKEVGSDLSLSVKTISTYRARILKKTGLQNNAQIIRYAVRNGIIEVAGAG